MGKGILLSIFREQDSGSLTWQKCCCSACKPRSQRRSCLDFPERAPNTKAFTAKAGPPTPEPNQKAWKKRDWREGM